MPNLCPPEQVEICLALASAYYGTFGFFCQQKNKFFLLTWSTWRIMVPICDVNWVTV